MWKVISRNSAYGLLQFVMTAALVFVMTPTYLRALGDYDYGIWQIISALLGYANILDLGMQPTVSRYVAAYMGGGKPRRLSRLFSTSLCMLLGLAVVPMIAFLIFAAFSDEILAEAAAGSRKYALVTALVAVGIPLTFARFVYVSFLEGLQRYDWRAIVGMAHGIAFAIAFVVLMPFADPLILMAGLSVTLGISRIAVLWWGVRRTSPVRVRFVPTLFDRRLARELLGFGGKSFIQGLATSAESRADTLIIGAGLGPAMVAFYSLPQTLCLYIRSLGWTLSHAFMPALSSLAGSDSHSHMKNVLIRGSRYVLALVVPLAGGIALLGRDFIELWVGEEYAANAGPLIWVLTAYFFVPFLFPLQSRYLTAINMHGIFAKLYPCRAVMNIGLSIALLPSLGLLGVALGSLIPEVLVLGPVARRLLEISGVAFTEYAREVWLPSVLPAVLLVATTFLLKSVIGTAGWLPFFLVVAGVSSVYVAALVVSLYRVEPQTFRAVAGRRLS